MYNYTLSVSNKDLVNIARRAFNLVDPRLIDHGARVAYLVSILLKADSTYTDQERRNLLILAALHDIGAYKTEEIDKMVEFETVNMWNHSIYGYLFFHYFTPFNEMSAAVLFHHTPWKSLCGLPGLSKRLKQMAQIINLADRIDIYCDNSKRKPDWDELCRYLEKQKGLKYSDEVLELFRKADFSAVSGAGDKRSGSLRTSEDLDQQFDEMLEAMPFCEEEKDALLRMLIYAIDFRSPHTVTHTITTTMISVELAKLLCSKDEVNDVLCGAMLHDMGKIGIPVEILEFPGKLSPQAMSVMWTHVDLTEHILGDSVSETVREIALRHHEKLDGSGYPKGLTGVELDKKQRIVAVADIVSALTGTRSYKDAYSQEKTVNIITGMAQKGLIDRDIVALITDNFQSIMDTVQEITAPILQTYQEMQDQYGILSQKLMAAFETGDCLSIQNGL